MELIVGIGDYHISNQKEDVLKTFALASCVAVTVYCPLKMASGMIHIALPEAVDDSKNNIKPGYYATTGIPLLLKAMEESYGCKKEGLLIELFGGANSIKENDVFLIGQKNLQAIKRILDHDNLAYTLVEVGGFVSRTIEMNAITGDIKLMTQSIRI